MKIKNVSGRPCVLSIAGFDPSAGAGLLADAKVFEAHSVCGFGVCSALTAQSDNTFAGVSWISPEQIAWQINPLAERFEVRVAKIGLIESLEALSAVTSALKAAWPKIEIVWDPIGAASAGFEFHREFESKKLLNILGELSLVTPNLSEISLLVNSENPLESTELLSRAVPVLLKGGHGVGETVTDLFVSDGVRRAFTSKRLSGAAKHGSGCVLSAAIIACRAQGLGWEEAIARGRSYVGRFLKSNDTLLGFHGAIATSE